MYKLELNDPLFLPHCACDIRLEIATHQGLLLTGENGIGKSTLMHRFSDSYPAFSLTPQKALDLFFDRTLKKLKEVFLFATTEKINTDAFNFLWQMLELAGKESRFLSELSGGESQALKLCLGLSKESDLFFMDEPSQFLDKPKKETLAAFLEGQRLKGKSFLVIEHDYDWLPKGWRASEVIQENHVLKVGKTWTT